MSDPKTPASPKVARLLANTITLSIPLGGEIYNNAQDDLVKVIGLFNPEINVNTTVTATFKGTNATVSFTNTAAANASDWEVAITNAIPPGTYDLTVTESANGYNEAIATAIVFLV